MFNSINRQMQQSMNQQKPQYSEEAKTVVIKLLEEQDKNPKRAYSKFTELSDEKLKSGRAPNSSYGEAVNLLTSLVPYQEIIDKIQLAKNKTKNKVFDNLIYDNVVQMNTILDESVFDLPDILNLTPNGELNGYKQALIQIQNILPQTKGKEREDLLWINDILIEYIDSLQGSKI